MRRTRSASTHVQVYVQDQLRSLLEGGAYPTQGSLAEAMGVTQAQISQAKNEGKAIGPAVIEGLAKVLSITEDELKRRALERSKATSGEPELFRVERPSRPLRNEELPGWAEAEKEARRQSNLLDWTFLVARGRTGIVPRQGVTREYVISEAVQALNYAKPEDAVLQTNREIAKKAEAAVRKAKRRKHKTRQGV